MAFGSFNRKSGPFSQPGGEGGGGGQNQFGNFPRSPSPSPPPVFPVNNNYYSPPPQQRHSPRPSVSPPRWGSQTYRGPSAAEPYVGSPNAAVNIPARFANIEGPRRPRAPPSANNIYLDDFTQDVSVAAVPSISPPRWGAHTKSSFGDSISGAHQRPSSVPPYVAQPSMTDTPARPSNFQVLPIRKSPRYNDEVPLDNFTQSSYGRGLGGPQKMQSPSQAFVGSRNVEDLHHPSSRWPTEPSNFQPPQKNTPIPLQSATERIRRRSNPSQGDTNGAVVSPPMFGKTSTFSMNNSNRTSQQRSSPFSPHNEAEGARSKTMNSQVPKRNRSPSLASSEEHIPGTLNSTSDDTEREVQAKARRLARFGVELSEPVQRNTDHIKQKSPANRHDQAFVERSKFIPDQPAEAAGDYMQSDCEGLEPSSVIVGLCPDMCPESERQERERKGDLDRYERLDGDRNQTTTSLAVKKYNRTADREADLIRPMPVLQQTMNYLLVLLDQPYDDRFLSMYNFLWDRMRAIRMDLRMQHIFNEEAITMLEQMIRLHIVAMHELCEYTKGEGFSEGFDAHLNIEQMNKTSVELFQMYDDHRKKGSTVVSEKEFRGYYALLKLDKHPGYKVEPAELSLDLAKMTPEIRQTPEILFARAVARACRTGNFIAFFRLARKATYLQACLMHAHFAKLRTQALVSLHSGLQNQGIPIAQVTKWLGMEGEDIDGLLEYHGFLAKEFEESYMVKEGPFLNVDKDYPTKCSQLVHLKKSRRIIEDVSSSNQSIWPAEDQKHIELDKKVKTEFKTIQSVTSRPLLDVVDEVMEEEPVLLHDPQVEPGLELPLFDQTVISVNEVSPVWVVPSFAKPTRETLRSDSLERTRNVQSIPFPPVLEIAQPSESPVPSVVITPQKEDETLITCEDSEDEESMIHDNESENEEDMALAYQDEEVAMAKLKLILRKWKRVSSKRKELREQRQLAASFALSSLTLGPPINRMKAPLSHVLELDLDRAAKERRARQERSMSKMNPSEIVGEILSERNPNSKCICWKLIFSSQSNGSSQMWLHSKLIGHKSDNTNDESIWQTWVPHHDDSLIRCLSVIKEVKFDMLTEETFVGSGGFLFLVSETTPLDVQKTHLHHLSMSFPSGSHLPLLILHGGQQEESLINGLGLNELDRTRVGKFSIRSITEDGFFDSLRLREGLQWLARESPAQPVVHCVKPRDLIIHHLSASLGRLDNKNANPNDCISAFNEALEISITEITTAAESNPSGWPPLEIESDLPSVGWSSDSRIKPILSRIQSLKLQFFQDDLSWLDYGYEILRQKSELEDCLSRYLTLWMDKDLATREACVALQKGSFIELQGSGYRIRPNWVQIFRRIFNWRLMEDEDSLVYVLERQENNGEEEEEEEEELGFDLGGVLSLPCLDEMVGVCYNTRIDDAKEVLHSSSDEMEEEDEVIESGVERVNFGGDYGNEVVVGGNEGKKLGDKLSELLEKCNVLQDKIDEKLSFYF